MPGATRKGEWRMFKRIRLRLAIWTAICVFSSIVGMGIEPASAHLPEHTVSAGLIGTYTSQPGETLAAFVQRVGIVLWAWTKNTGREGCGPIARLPSGLYVIQLTTEQAQTTCIIATDPPAGSDAVLIGESLHSHPPVANGVIRLTRHDRLVFRQIGDWSRANAYVVDAEPCGFSDTDVAGGAGYLVACGELWHQHGRGTQTVVATLP